MSTDDFILALRALDALVFLDNRGTAGLLGTEFTATTSDGKSVFVTQLSPALNDRITDPDAFVSMIKRGGYQGAGITESGQLYFLELPPRGVSLARQIVTNGPLLAVDLVVIARAAIAALENDRSRGRPHGMVTPSTLHVASDGVVSVRWPLLVPALVAAGVDLGFIEQELSMAAFVAPEVRAGDSLSLTSDIFALGATLYTALTGRQPFGGRTTATVMAAVLADQGAPETLVAQTLTAVLLRAIEQNPADRWDDLARFGDALSSAVESGKSPTGQAITPGRPAWHRVVVVTVVSGLVLWLISRYLS